MDAQLLSDDEFPSRRRDNKRPAGECCVVTACAALMALLFLCVLTPGFVIVLTSRRPEFSVAVDGFSGLEDRVPRAFNLTVGVDNLGGTFEVCIGGEAVVLYGGVPLAGGRVQDLCVPPKRAAEVAVATTASGGVGVPKPLAELMAAEKRADGAVRVEVRVISAKHRTLLSCTATLDQVAARPHPCQEAVLIDESDGVRPDGSGTPGFL